MKERIFLASAARIVASLGLIAWFGLFCGVHCANAGPASSSAPPTFVQSASTAQTRGATASKAYSGSVTSGDLLVVGTFIDVGATVSITDTLGDTFTQVAHQTVANDHDANVLVAIARSSGTDTITVNVGAGKNVYAFSIHEYSGVTAVVDISATAQGNGVAPASGNLTTTSANDLIFAWFTNGSNFRNENFSSLSSSYTKREMSGTGTRQCYAFADCVESGDLVTATTLTTNATATINVADIWSATAIALKGSSDTTPPSIPTGLTVTGTTTSTVSLSWTASTDNVGVAGYNIYRGGVQVGTSPTTSYTDAGLAPSTTYSYTLSAYDAAGNTSAQSGSVQATTLPPLPTITSFAASPASISAGQTSTLSWSVANATSLTLNNGIGAVTGTTSINVSPTTTTVYTLTATNSAGSVNAQATVTVSSDTTPPVVNVTAPVSGATVSGTVTISATATDNVAVASVAFKIDGVVLTTVTNTPYSTAWVSTSAANGTHSITATAIDTSGNQATSTAITVTVSNSSRPMAFIQSASTAQTNGQAASKAFPGSVTSGDLLVVGTFIDVGATVSVTDSLGDTFTQVAHQTVANDHDANVLVATAGSSGNAVINVNVSSGKNVYAFSIHEYSGVTPVVDVSATAQGNGTAPAAGNLTTTNPNDLIFAWFTNGSNFQNENFSSLNSSYSKREMSGTGTQQCYAFANCVGSGDLVTATTITTNATATINVADMWSAMAIAFKGSSTDTTPPSIPAGLTVTGTTTTTISLSWAASTDNVGVAGYNIYRGGVQVGTSPITSYTDAGLAPSTTYSYTVSAYDAAGNTSAQSGSVQATTLPPLPTITSFAANPASISAGQTSALSWSVANATSLTLNNGVGTVTGKTSVNVSPATTTVYTLTATNSAGSVNAQATVTVSSDTTPPSIPTGLTVTGTTTTTVSLSWTASTDNVGVAGYEVYRGGVQVGTSPTTSYTDTGLAPSTAYSYTVAAYDAAGNTSAQSGSVQATTLPPLPTITSFIANPASISVGQMSALSWSVANATSLTLDNGIGTVTGKTSVNVSPATTTVYTLTATNGTGSATAQSTVTVSTDTTPPVVSVTAPVSGATVSGTVTISADATDNVAVASVAFKIDGIVLATITNTPYATNWNSTATANGTHSITATATDTSGNQATSTAIAVTVSNSSRPMAFIQSASAAQTSGQAASKAFPGSVTSGDLLVVGTFVDVGATVSVTDSLGDTFTQVAHQTVANDHDANVLVATAASSGNAVVTVNVSSGRNVYAFSIHEYSGITPVVDVSTTAQGNGTAPASGNVTTTNPNDLVFAWFTNGSNFQNENFSSINPSYAKREMSGTGTQQCYAFANCVGSGDIITSSTLTTNATATINVSDIWSATVVAFKGSSSSGDTTPPSIPAGLTLVGTTQTTASFSWTASTDNVGVAGYDVFRNDVLIGTTTQTSYTDGPLSASTTYNYTVAAFDAAGNVSAKATPELAATTLPISGGSGSSLKASANGRYLVDQNNVPAFVMGDSPHSLLVDLDPATMVTYMADRQARRFNAILVQALCNTYTGGYANGTTYDGVPPFTSGSSPSNYDLSTPNPAYFSRLDSLVTQAATYSLAVFLDPIDTGGWMTTLENNGSTKAFNYGVYLGTRYKNSPNIVWDSGNDFNDWNTNPTDNNLVRQVMAGIASVDPNHLQTIELNALTSYSSQDTAIGSLITLNSAYTYSPTYDMVLQAYNSSAGIPVFMTEANYEYENNVGALPGPTGVFVLREQEYWTILSGGTSQLYGNHYTWTFNGPSGVSNWQSFLDSPGAMEIQYFMGLFEALPWWNLVPDAAHVVVTAGYGSYDTSSYNLTTNTYSPTAWVTDGSLSVTYDLTASILTVNMAKFKGAVTARWYDPSNGTYATIPGSPFSNSGSLQFTPLSHNHDGNSDWVLVLQTAGP